MNATRTNETATIQRRPRDRRERILDAAERLARHGGYYGFSFRDVAAGVGVKSASIHHHFPTKEDLATALASRYRARFLDSLGDPGDSGALDRLVAGYRAATGADDQMCLCGLLGAEADALPAVVGEAVQGFFRANVDWPARALQGDETQTRAETLIAGLTGVLVIARNLGDANLFDRVAGRLVAAAV